jgi:hypothetical protein
VSLNSDVADFAQSYILGALHRQLCTVSHMSLKIAVSLISREAIFSAPFIANSVQSMMNTSPPRAEIPTTPRSTR